MIEPREWTLAEIRLLGKKSDDEIARILRRSASSVQTKRLRLGIPTPVKWNQRWTKDELRWIGKLPDDKVAQRTGRSVWAASLKRRELGLPKLQPKCRLWTHREDVLIGKFRDEEVARRVGRTPPHYLTCVSPPQPPVHLDIIPRITKTVRSYG